jgi:hypothetical protein
MQITCNVTTPSAHLAAECVQHDGAQPARLLHGCLQVVQRAPVVLNGAPGQVKPAGFRVQIQNSNSWINDSWQLAG